MRPRSHNSGKIKTRILFQTSYHAILFPFYCSPWHIDFGVPFLFFIKLHNELGKSGMTKSLTRRSCDLLAFVSVFRMAYLLIQQIFIRCLPCTRHCSETKWLLVNKADKGPCPLGTYILEGRGEIANNRRNKLSDDQEDRGHTSSLWGSLGWSEQASPQRGNLSKDLKETRTSAE